MAMREKTEHHCIHDDAEVENKKQERELCQRGGAVACKSAHAEVHVDSVDNSGCYSLQNCSRLLLASK